MAWRLPACSCEETDCVKTEALKTHAFHTLVEGSRVLTVVSVEICGYVVDPTL